MKRIFLVLVISVLCKGCLSTTNPQEVTVYVAASLTPALTKMAAAFKAQQGVRVVLNSASSGTLARQIAQGAPADLFISANQTWIDYLQSEGMLFDQQRLPIRNQLVLIAPIDSSIEPVVLTELTPFSWLTDNQRLAIGDPQHVPVGQYATQALIYHNWSISPDQMLLAKDARAALVAVELGEVAIGIAYMSDMQKSTRVRKIGIFQENAHAPIHYFAGICSKNPQAATFMNFINSPEVKSIWEKQGFVL